MEPGKPKTPAKRGQATRGPIKGKKRAGQQYRRPRGGAAKSVGELMPQIGRTAFRRFGFVQSNVVTRWPEIVGPTHAKVCAPEAIRFPPGEKTEGIVARVKIRQGEVKPPSAEEKPKPPPSLKPIPMELGDSLRDIGDPELRTVLESLARSMSEKETKESD